MTTRLLRLASHPPVHRKLPASFLFPDLHGQAAHDSAPKAPDAFAQMGPQLPRTNGPAATTHARNAIHGIRTRDTCIFGHAASANSNTTNLLQAWDSALGQLLCPIFERNMVNARAVHSAFDGTRSNSLDFANAMILCLEPLSDSSAQPIHSRLRSSSPRHSSAPTLTTRFLRLLRLASHPPVQRKFPASFLLTPSVMPPLDHAAAGSCRRSHSAVDVSSMPLPFVTAVRTPILWTMGLVRRSLFSPDIL